MLANRVRMGSGSGKLDPSTWKGIQKIVRKGIANEFFTVGDQLMALYDGVETVFEVIGIDVETPSDTRFTHSMTLQTKNCLHILQFDSRDPSDPGSSFGDTRYIYSALKQWLNSDEATFSWQPQHTHDAKPDDSLDVYNGAGFLNRLDTELANVLGPVEKNVAEAPQGVGQGSFNDKVFLLSRVEVGFGTEGKTTGESVYPFYDGVANAKRIKELDGSPRRWWLRSPNFDYLGGLSGYVRCVNSDGSMVYYYAHLTTGVAPACVII